MTKKKEFLRRMDTVHGFLSFLELALNEVRTKMSEHPGVTHEDEVKLLGLITILKTFDGVSTEAIADLEDFIETHKFKV